MGNLWLKKKIQDHDAEEQRQADIQNSEVSEKQLNQSQVDNQDLNLNDDLNQFQDEENKFNEEEENQQEENAPVLTDEELVQMIKEVQNELLRDKKKEHFRSKLKSKLSEKFKDAEEPRYFYRYVCRNNKEQKIREKIDIDEYFEEDSKSIYFQNLVSKLVESSLFGQEISVQEMLV